MSNNLRMNGRVPGIFAVLAMSILSCVSWPTISPEKSGTAGTQPASFGVPSTGPSVVAASPEVLDGINGLLKTAFRNDARILSQDERKAIENSIARNPGERWLPVARRVLDSADLDGDGTLAEGEWRRYLELAKAKAATRPANPQTFMVLMSDRKKLATDVHLPACDGPFPAVLTRTPYSRKGPGMDAIAKNLNIAGCAFVVQDMRGRFESEGENLPFVGCGWGEHKDGVETVAWLLKQPWCNGKIGMTGGSAPGITQNLLAAAGEKNVACQYIGVAAASLYHHAAYVGGAFRKDQVEKWTSNNKFDKQALELMVQHPSFDDYWRQYDTTARFDQTHIPAVHQGGWFDTFSQGTIDSFVGRQHKGGEGARGSQKLLMGPWAHGGWRKEGVGELVFPNGATPKGYDQLSLFDHYLAGVQNDFEKLKPVAYYVMGDTAAPGAPGNEWRFADDWPVPAMETPYYFTVDGTLKTDKPVAADKPASVEYTFNPADPCPTVGGKNLCIANGPMNQNRIESRKDVLLFTSDSLESPVEVTGRVKARVFVASSAVDTDISVRLCDVYPDGKSYEMAEGILRLRYRNSFEKPEPLKPGEITEVAIDCWSTSIVFNKAHRIRAIVTSSNYPRFDVNPGTGQPWTDEGEKVRQTNTIFCGGKNLSCILLPIVEAKKEAK